MDFKIQDKALMWYKREYDKHKVTLMDEIEDIKGRFTYDGLKEYKRDLSRFKRESQKAIQLNILTPYQQYMAKKWLVASKIKARDMLLWYLIYKYAYFNYLTKELEKVVFDKVNKHFVEETIKQCKEITKKDYKIDYEKLTEEALQEPNNMGYIWDKYKDTSVDYNANEMYNQLVIDMRNGTNNIDVLIDRQQGRIIKIKKKDAKISISGTLENEIDFITTYSQLQIFAKYGIDKIRYIAVMDIKTCHECRTLDNQIFSMSEFNEFIKYKASDKEYQRYKIKGIIIGENAPPIHSDCRCYLVPEKGE